MRFFKQRRYSLSFQINILLGMLIVVTLIGGGVTIWYSYQMESLFENITTKELSAFQRAESIEKALINQKGLASYYFLDGDENWLKQIKSYRDEFKKKLNESKSLAIEKEEKNIIYLIQSEYDQYKLSRDSTIELYKAGKLKPTSSIHNQVRTQFLNILNLCDKYKNFHKDRINSAVSKAHIQAKKLRIMVLGGIIFAVSLTFFILFILLNNILKPIRKLTIEASRQSSRIFGEDEIKALSNSVTGLIKDVNHTHSELEKSREILLQAEKMALVGKLAASTAHSIRNPFTSVKMRLFSLSRSLNLDDNQRDDIDVISEEIRHIDNILQNFLEFSRPPKLKMQKISPSIVIDSVLTLMKYRLTSYNLDIKIVRKKMLPEIYCDPEQLKEVFVNFVINACEAMKNEGSITIYEEEFIAPSIGRIVNIQIKDNGPGISDSIKEKIFQPFFTTKQEGTGLGLSIALRIIKEHRGSLDVISKEGNGANFIVTLPV
ncbi:MAG: MCP four helix bundle domain-containing protein [Desulfobacterales bacterium]|nr:MCP four helix bundle domain-containing protein [Desulfobacterales bacterium]